MRINLNTGMGTAETSLDKSASTRGPAAMAQAPAESQFSANEANVSSLLSGALAATRGPAGKDRCLKGSACERHVPDFLTAHRKLHIRSYARDRLRGVTRWLRA
jgi:hypothetical protein